MLLKITCKMKSSFILNIRIILEYLLVFLIYKILNILPTNLVTFLGGSIFKLFGPLTKTHKIVIKNLFQIFPTNSKMEIEKKAKNSWANTGKTFFELLILPKIINSRNRIVVEGKNYLDEIISNDEKVIFFSIHQSNWEILLPTIDKKGVAVGGIYRHINNPLIDKLILKIRKKSILSNKSFYTPKGIKSAKDILEGLKKNISLVLLIDQKDSAGEIIEFFNFPSKTNTGFIKIARKQKLRIVPVQNIRNSKNEFVLRFHKPLNRFSDQISDTEIIKEIYGIVESWIIESPSNWFLQHNRFS